VSTKLNEERQNMEAWINFENEKIILALDQTSNNFFKVDFDIMKTLASSLKITAIPVVLFLVNGVECARVIGFGKDTDKKIRKTIKTCLKKAMKPSKKKPRKVKKTS
jgi:thioredoxin-like negative regulator of GroEL